MARLKKTREAAIRPPAAPEPVPEHVRTSEWQGLKTGDRVAVRMPGRKMRRGFRWYFSNHVLSPQGVEYVDVLECRVGYTNGLWRSFPPDSVTPWK